MEETEQKSSRKVIKKKSKAYRVLRVMPDAKAFKSLPKSFQKILTKKSKRQNKIFTVVLLPLTNKEYRLFSTSRYSLKNVLKILNEHIIPIGVGLEYIIKWPLLIKLIVDSIYKISGEIIEDINRDPQKLFDTLRKNRERWSTIDSLPEQLIITNAGLDTYMKIQDKDFEETLMLAALIEKTHDIVIEERYDAARRRNWQIPIKLHADRTFRKEYQRMTSQDGVADETFEETGRALDEAIRREKKMKELGIKSRINTEEENKALRDM